MFLFAGEVPVRVPAHVPEVWRSSRDDGGGPPALGCPPTRGQTRWGIILLLTDHQQSHSPKWRLIQSINQSPKASLKEVKNKKKCLRNFSSRTWTFLQPRNNNEKQIFLIGINLQPNGKLLLKPTAQLKVLQTFPLNNILIWNTLIYKVMLLEGKWADWNCVIIFSEYDN